MSTPTRTPSPISHTATLDAVCDQLEEAHPADAEPLCDFARLFFAKVPRALLQERSTATLAAVTESAYRFLERARRDAVDVQVTNPEDDAVPWDAPVTVIRAEVGDRPFIVDTIREYLAAEGLTIFHAVYPVLQVQRDGNGEIQRVALPGDGDGALEALVHLEVSRIADAQRRAEVEAEVARRLGDVVEATTDFPVMLRALEDTVALMDTYAERFPGRAEEFSEVREFLSWLTRDNFVFLGYRAYDIIGEEEQRALLVEAESGLGILRNPHDSTYAAPVPLASLSEAFRARVEQPPLLLVSKANAESTVHRRARLDYIGVKTLDEGGRVDGERRFLGLFTSKAYAEHAELIPILRRKLHTILDDVRARPGTHDYKEIITIFNSMPKEALFQGTAEQLEVEVQAVLATLFSDEARVLLRPDAARRGINVMVILPRGKFSGEVRRRIEALLAERLQGRVLNYYLAMGAGDQARLHFYLATPEAAETEAATRALEREIGSILRSWEDRFHEEVAAVAPALAEAAEVEPVFRLYVAAFSAEYRAANSPEAAAHDVVVMERMRLEGHTEAVDLRGERTPDGEAGSSLKLYVREERVVLSDFMPILDYAGVRVVEVDTFALAGPGLPSHMIYSFKVQAAGGGPLPEERTGILAETLLAVRAGDTAADAFTALVLAAGLRWREADILRAYAGYAFQIGAIPSRAAAARGLAAYPEMARLLVELFRARFDPEQTGREAEQGRLRGAILRALEGVESLAEDRAFRRLLGLIGGTVRTNYFRHGGADPTVRSGGVPYLSFKVRDADVEDLKKCGLMYEVYVASSRMEGIHLRGAPVSRGGIRWSDRPDDFRTEIMGLVQTQMTKNAVIVPGGSKGGFVPLRRFADRERMGEEAAQQYRTLIRGLLDITDNLRGSGVVPPPGVVRYDGDDPYLVVAADKGTAHLSDTANEVAAEYGFWLGDAFASGGSHGYDHKEEGITARGAWECVRRHFREMGKDIQTEPFTVAGIGDMSGDVFGNGMLLSREIRLLAAFDHRHVFLDPDPDPEVSFRERERLFHLPRSSWEDYDRSALSPGAMIVPRASKSVEVTPEVRRALGLAEGEERLDGEALVRAVLRAPVELLWNGGIGTYVKQEEETNAEVGDSANDPVRVNAVELRCQVVGEGGNLGFTQAARVAFALGGGRINTDALDNSAGVDMSDHEVNLKILLNCVVSETPMMEAERNRLLEGMTNTVSELVLADNVNQSLAVSLDEARSREALESFAALMRDLERDGWLERTEAALPPPAGVRERAIEGEGLTRPSLCVLLANSKLQAKTAILASALPDDPATEPYLVGYFPAAAVEMAGMEQVRAHQLRREIIATELVNDLVDLMGASFLDHMERRTGRGTPAIARAWLIASRISGAPEIRRELQALEGRFPATVVYRWLHGLARVLEGTVRWALANVPAEEDAEAVIRRLQGGLSTLRGRFREVVAGRDRELFVARVAEVQELGADQALAERLITLRFLPQLLEIIALVPDAAGDALATARAYYEVSDHLALTALRRMLAEAAGEDPWERRFAEELTEDLTQAQRRITRAVLADGGDAPRAVQEWEREHDASVRSYRELLQELGSDAPLAGYASAVRQLSAAARG